MKSYELTDVESVSSLNPKGAVRNFERAGKGSQFECDLAIVGGGTGGVAASLAACSAGLSVCLIEETSWLGGQMTSQGVSALDENYLVESTGATREYKKLREAIRNHYRALGASDGGARFEPYLDPGNCWVSRLAFEPKVAIKVISELLHPFLKNGLLKIFTRSKAVDLKIRRKKIDTVHCVDIDTGRFFDLHTRFCIDASELGDLLPLAKMNYRSGAESRSETGEAHAPEIENRENVQDFTYPFIVEFCPNESHKIPRPARYDEFLAAGRFSFLGYKMFENAKKKTADGREVELLPFWEYRRLIAKSNFDSKVFPNDIAMINWESNDVRAENIIDQASTVMAQRLALGKDLSLGFLYWMQTEVERDDGGKGYPELKLRADLMGTKDGLSKYPYIRESRRIVPLKTVLESHLTSADNPNARAKWCSDSLGIGLYPIDIHGHQDVPGAGQATKPFQIPASCLVQEQVRNYLPAAKNIGVTHITNGAYRLHPIEWAIGEACGIFAAVVLERHSDIVRVYKNRKALAEIQRRLLEFGAPVVWFDDIKPEDEIFAAAQYAVIQGYLQVNEGDLHFRRDDSISRSQLATALHKLLRLDLPDGAKPFDDLEPASSEFAAANSCVAAGFFSMKDNSFGGAQTVTVDEFNEILGKKCFKQLPAKLRKISQDSSIDAVTKGHFVSWLFEVLKANARLI